MQRSIFSCFFFSLQTPPPRDEISFRLDFLPLQISNLASGNEVTGRCEPWSQTLK